MIWKLRTDNVRIAEIALLLNRTISDFMKKWVFLCRHFVLDVEAKGDYHGEIIFLFIIERANYAKNP